ncbi:ABC transporter permease [Actinomadura rupiterrae]|uniref:ABC transporter permease n=1 Tax=Actinomadura rupiterrae TaxID=559627 RepID=UPI0020A23D1B|nr:ABC transporter permease [Actinomadura rupiterrae]MCP2338886.1 putative ABC transport system permease protein [Actinomadura rupiterrae]
MIDRAKGDNGARQRRRRRAQAKREFTSTRLTPRDLIDEALAGMLTRPGRAGLTILGTVLGIAAFVSVLGLTATASGQISKRFTALAATEVLVEDASPDPDIAGPGFPPDTEKRLTRLNGVVNAGLYWRAPAKNANGAMLVSARPPSITRGTGEALAVMAASPGYMRAVHATTSAGRLFDDFHQRTGQKVAVIGKAAAQRLGITRLDAQPAIFIGDQPVTVIGIIDNVDRQPEVLLSVLIPSTTATSLWGTPSGRADSQPKALIETRLGSAQLIAKQAPLAIRPEQPDRFKVTAPPDPRQLKDQVNTDLSALFLALAAICLLAGAVGIANTTLVAVLERTPEIGLRRALGAHRRHIVAQFLSESAVLGLLGGLAGTAAGVAIVVFAAVFKQWTPVLDPSTVFPAPLVGAGTGLFAGLYPAWRASCVEPIEALRR